ncbi:MAG: efflux RND transporter periplasmic adaptor subunit, partial [Acidobacteriota bacterium]
MKSLSWLIAGIVLASSAFLMLGPNKTVEGEPLATPTLPVAAAPTTQIEVVPATLTDLVVESEATGRLAAIRRVEMSGEVAGRVVWRGVDNGDWVDEGDVLVRLDDRQARLELAQAEANLLKIRAFYTVAYTFDERRDNTDQRGDTTSESSERLVETDEQGDVRAATSGLIQAEQDVARAELALEQTELRAPFSGRITDLTVEIGEQIGPGAPLLTLLDTSSLMVEVDVLETVVVRVGHDTLARIRVPALDDLELTGAIEHIAPEIDPEHGSATLVVRLESHPRLVPGLFVLTTLELARFTERLTVPSSAVPVLHGQGTRVRLYAGTLGDQEGPAPLGTPVRI